MSRSEEDGDDKPCRACSDFKSWAKKQGKVTLSTPPKPATPDCPLDKEELGRSTWGFLHSMAGYYPEKPTKGQEQTMATFLQALGEFYPCEPCALDYKEDLKKHPPQTQSRHALEKWLCDRHNTVNKKLGKPEFDCSKVSERWREGWKDGSCG